MKCRNRHSLLIKTTATVVVCLFVMNTCCYGLATLPASQNPVVKRKIIATLARTQIRYAESDEAKRLLEANNAQCLLLSSGKYLVAKGVAEDNLRLIRAIIHEDTEALMQILAKEEPSRYQAIRELVLTHFPPDSDNDLPLDLYVNHAIARAFEWLSLVEDGIIFEHEIPSQEKPFIEAIRPLIRINKHTCFTSEFWDLRERGRRIQSALNEGMRFYQVANGKQEPAFISQDSFKSELEGLRVTYRDKKPGVSTYEFSSIRHEKLKLEETWRIQVHNDNVEAFGVFCYDGEQNAEAEVTIDNRGVIFYICGSNLPLHSWGDDAIFTLIFTRSRDVGVALGFNPIWAFMYHTLSPGERATEEEYEWWAIYDSDDEIPDDREDPRISKIIGFREDILYYETVHGSEELSSLIEHAFEATDKKTTRTYEMLVSDFLKDASVQNELVKLEVLTPGPVQPRKCLVLDCDGVLWGGIVGEDGVEGIQLSPAHLEFQRKVKALQERGVILVINSKNNPGAVEEVFRKRPDMVLKAEDFALIKANWQDKATNIREITEELNIGADSFVFLDDSVHERELIQITCPEVLTPDLPENPAERVAFLDGLGVFGQQTVTDEDRSRAKLYEAKRAVDAVKAKIPSLEDFYRTLEMKAVIREGKENLPYIPRIVQLTQRTNQFNLTTRRYSEDDIRSFLANPDEYQVFTLELVDKFANHGMVGLIILHKSSDWVIDTFCLSCRAMGRTVEQAFMAHVMQKVKERKEKFLKGYYIKTDRNESVRDLYEKFGFEKSDYTPSDFSGLGPSYFRDKEYTSWRFDLDRSSLKTPDWIDIVTAGKSEERPVHEKGEWSKEDIERFFAKSKFRVVFEASEYIEGQGIGLIGYDDECADEPSRTELCILDDCIHICSGVSFMNVLAALVACTPLSFSPDVLQEMRTLLADHAAASGKVKVYTSTTQSFDYGYESGAIQQAAVGEEDRYVPKKGKSSQRTCLIEKRNEVYSNDYTGEGSSEKTRRTLFEDGTETIATTSSHTPAAEPDEENEPEGHPKYAFEHMPERPFTLKEYYQRTAVPISTARRDFDVLEELGLVTIHRGSGGKPNEIQRIVPQAMIRQALEILGTYKDRRDMPRVKGEVAHKLYDIEHVVPLFLDLLHAPLQEGRSYEIKYDTARLSTSQIEIIKTYISLLKKQASNPSAIKARPFSSEKGSNESLIAVYCTGKGFKGEGHVDIDIPEGDITDYLLRITGMVNIALAASNIPNDATAEELTTTYGALVGLIKNQYKAILGVELSLPGTPGGLLEAIRHIVLTLPRAHRMPLERIEEYNRRAQEVLMAA